MLPQAGQRSTSMVIVPGPLGLPTSTVHLVAEELGTDAEIANGVGQGVHFAAGRRLCGDRLDVGAYVGQVPPERCNIHMIPRRSVVVTLTAQTVPFRTGYLTNDRSEEWSPPPGGR
jgi:hypothetical protein